MLVKTALKKCERKAFTWKVAVLKKGLLHMLVKTAFKKCERKAFIWKVAICLKGLLHMLVKTAFRTRRFARITTTCFGFIKFMMD